jgi:hypothetical protein
MDIPIQQTSGLNDTLSLNRANTCGLPDRQGVDETRPRWGSSGERPHNANDPTTELQPLNRRVELIVNHWVPLTDHSVAEYRFHCHRPERCRGNLVTAATPTNKLVIIAGTGSISSNGDFANLTNKGIDLLRSTDGGVEDHSARLIRR